MRFMMLHPRQMREVVAKERALVIDLRELEEYRSFHYPGAYRFDYDKMEQWMRQMPRGRTIVLYCEHGTTSLMAARRLASVGYRVYTVNGGAVAMRKYVDMPK